MLKLVAVWLWFVAQLTPLACLDQPVVRIVQDISSADHPGAWGLYEPWFPGGRVTVEAEAPRFVAVHEMAHHLFYACHIAGRPLGRRFLLATGSGEWDSRAREEFAATLTWVLTGQGRQDIRRDAAWVFTPRVDTPNPGQAERLQRRP